MTRASDKELLAGLGKALQYPRMGLGCQIDELHAMARGNEVLQGELASFSKACESHNDDSLAEVYTRTFDVAPQCIPYLSIHLFGEEAFHRARLMVGLRSSLLSLGRDPAPELPDHFALLLQAAPHFPEEEWDDLVNYVVRAGIHAMAKTLEKASSSPNPYLPLLRAVQLLVGEATSEDIARLNTAKKNGKNCSPPGAQQSCGGGC